MARQNVRYQGLLIPGKIRISIRISIDDSSRITSEYVSMSEGSKNTMLTLYPIITVDIIRQSEVDENGNRIRAPYNPNDSLPMTKYTKSILLNNLKGIQKDLKIPEMYSYQGKRLELNETIAEKARRPFVVGKNTVELSAIVIEQPDESRVEGIKMKFNNEQSSIALTLNELDALIDELDNMDIDTISLLIYMNYINKPDTKTFTRETMQAPVVDIMPKNDFIE